MYFIRNVTSANRRPSWVWTQLLYLQEHVEPLQHTGVQRTDSESDSKHTWGEGCYSPAYACDDNVSQLNHSQGDVRLIHEIIKCSGRHTHQIKEKITQIKKSHSYPQGYLFTGQTDGESKL